MLEFKKRKYEKNFLQDVIFRLSFVSMPELLKSLPVGFRHSIKNPFELLEEKRKSRIQIILKKSGVEEERTESPVYLFTDKNKEKTVALSHDDLIIRFKKYEHFSSFKENVSKVVESFIKINPSIDLKEIRLRYINHIFLKEGDPLVWKNYISSSLLNVVDRFLDKDRDLSRIMSQVVLNKEDFNMIFNFGIHNSEYPAKISRKEFILDFNCYTNSFENDDICRYLEKFNAEAGFMFEKSINNGLRKKMGEIQ